MAPTQNTRPNPDSRSEVTTVRSPTWQVNTVERTGSVNQDSGVGVTSREEDSKCPECSKHALVTESDVRYCEECGVVVADQRLERSEPWWTDRENRRLGPKQSAQWVNAGTDITPSAIDDSYRLVRYNNRLTNDEQSLATGLREIRCLSSSLELAQQTRERAAYLYREAARQRLLKGRSIEAFAAACVFIATREENNPMTIDWVERHSPISGSKIRHHVRVLRSELSISIPPAHPRDFLPLIASRLSLDPTVEHRAAQYMERVTEDEIHVGKHPAAVAAAVAYAAANDAGVEVIQDSVATAADVSVVTISRRHQEVREVLI